MKKFYVTELERTVKINTYDSYGNPTKTTVVGKRGPSLSLDSVSSEMSYSSDGRFLLGKKDPLDHAVRFSYNSVSGVLESSTGTNRKTTTYEYGPFNRRKKTITPDRTEVLQTLVWNTESTAHPDAHTMSWSSSSGKSPVQTYYDAVGRPLTTVYQGFSGEDVYVEMRYDSKGRQSRQSLPYLSDALPLWTKYYYDDFGRVDSIISPDSTVIEYSYNDSITTIQRKKGSTLQYSITTRNVLGEVVTSEDSKRNKVNHFYLPDLKLAFTTTNSHSDSVIFSYDAQGNRNYL